jgi:hypothetical protein
LNRFRNRRGNRIDDRNRNSLRQVFCSNRSNGSTSYNNHAGAVRRKEIGALKGKPAHRFEAFGAVRSASRVAEEKDPAAGKSVLKDAGGGKPA